MKLYLFKNHLIFLPVFKNILTFVRYLDIHQGSLKRHFFRM